MTAKQTRRVVTGGMQAGEPGASIRAGADGRRWQGCPCGCLTRLPWIDDPACIRHRPVRTEVDICRGMFGPRGQWQPCCRGDAA